MEKYQQCWVMNQLSEERQEVCYKAYFPKIYTTDVESMLKQLGDMLKEIKEAGFYRMEMTDININNRSECYYVFRMETDKEYNSRLLYLDMEMKKREDAIETAEREQLKKLQEKYKE